MSVLKKGSKGKPVKELQTLLNRAHGALEAKPHLKVDGIFGKNTDKAVRAFQKGAKLKTDGKAGNNTLAAVRFGGPLPEMKVEDYEKWLEAWRFKRLALAGSLRMFDEIEQLLKKACSVLDKQVPIAFKISSENYKHRDTILELAAEIVDKQKQFKERMATWPQRAPKLAKECVDLDKKLQSLYKGKLLPNLNKAKRARMAPALEVEALIIKVNGKLRSIIALSKEGFRVWD